MATSLAAALSRVLPPEYVTTAPEECRAFAVHGAVPVCVAAPSTADELAAVVRIAAEQRIAVVPWGGGTQQAIGSPLWGRSPTTAQHPEPDLFAVVGTTRLNRVLLHEPADLTISVEAGMTLGALRAHLAQRGQMLPLDPPLPGRATIGGLIATAADGPRRYGYGTLRDLLIGIAVVDAGGQVTRAGGMVVKNVSGFDMMKLYLGSFGTLAVIVSANFKLLPAPRAAASLLCRFERRADAFAFIDALQATQLTPAAVEYLEDAGTNGQGAEAGPIFLTEPHGSIALALRAEGLPAAVERHMADLAALAVRHGAGAAERYDGDAEPELWARIADLPQTAEIGPDTALIKFSTLPGTVDRVIERVVQHAGRYEQRVTISARALNGVIYARLRPVSPSSMRALAETIPGLQWVATHVPGAPRWGTPTGIDVMRRIKAEFDPTGILNPGRFVDGL